ncbi:prepilin-type N-terminal cleavage/methylation domain-containing protein [Moritella sp.]
MGFQKGLSLLEVSITVTVVGLFLNLHWTT